MMLTSRYQMWMAWGPDLTFFCNDAYRPTLGVKYPWAVGQPAKAVWAEIWPDIGPLIDQVLRTGDATYSEGMLLLLERSGFKEETYHTFSYSPLFDDAGAIAGMFCVVVEETERVINERRLDTLRMVAQSASATKTEDELFHAVAAQLEKNRFDLPFTLSYVFDETGAAARLVARSGIGRDHPLATDLPNIANGPWPVEGIASGDRPAIVTTRTGQFASLPTGAWDKPPEKAIIVPFAQQTHDAAAAGFMIVGLNPYRTVEQGYEGFVTLLAGQIAAALANSRAYEEERKRAEALAEIDRAKTAFFSNVSHEFRTPLTLMLGPLEDLVSKPEDELRPANRELATVAHRNGLRLLKLVNTLLDFSRIEAGRVDAMYEPVDLGAHTAELASTFRSAIERAGLELIVDTPPLAEPVYVDRDMWEKIVMNLLSNAFKFTLEGRIEVQTIDRGDHVLLKVRDTGTGIPEDALPHLFERFYRVQGAEGRTHEGSGIGLALVHELVKIHEGRVDVESRVGEGSTFTVCIPRGKAHLPADRIRQGRKLQSTALGSSPFIEEALRWLPDGMFGNEGEAPDDERGPGVGEGAATILLADDNSDMRDYVHRLLSPQYKVITVADGREAIETMRRERPDLMLTDVMMPGLDGFALLREVRGDRDIAATPVIMLSARAGEEARAEGLSAGADDYMIKPFTARELLARVNGMLAVARARRESAERVAELRAETAEILDTMKLAFVALDEDYRYVYLNREAEAVIDCKREDFLGTTVWDQFPAIVESEAGRLLKKAMTERVIVRYENYYEPWGGWYEVNAYPMSGNRLGVFFNDITESRRTQEALREAKESAEEANRSKDRFLAVLSHELRTPLSPVLMSVTAMEADPALPPAMREEMLMIRRNIELETRLIDDLLDVSRIVSGKLALHPRTVDLNEKIKNVTQICREQILEKAIRLHVSLDRRIGGLRADPSRLQQVLWNVLKNAAKFTPEGGDIYVSTALTPDGKAEVTVRDTGIGIGKEALPAIFDAFEQGGAAITRQFGGLGLGLAISKVLVELHGGSIRAESPGVGQGATFTITLPEVEAASDERPEEHHGDAASRVKDVRLLIVEDHPDTARILARLLMGRGYTVRTAGTVAMALDALKEPVDLLISDVGLPDGTGYELMRRAREERPVTGIAMSGFGMEEDLARSREAGFAEHLVKPVDVAQIDEAIRRLLKSGG
jgi:PAS domain S-box-containing protein